ncbi:Alpha/Beta hydrolase protein [Blyttiomyces helicus]|uniref:Alpha/Beta hydrolase protein n=1 Tax=Blyttiomyces helicus TaxID=388810 RepID=A0A4V1IRB7_9FUNG|nr:Alpha/Beta hydrolase protein [Blyttiomyces helicus]|eukprot:RKO89497.1 Alpha/Beta hydrolase protein [Blyttiomyces helicus]
MGTDPRTLPPLPSLLQDLVVLFLLPSRIFLHILGTLLCPWWKRSPSWTLFQQIVLPLLQLPMALSPARLRDASNVLTVARVAFARCIYGATVEVAEGVGFRGHWVRSKGDEGTDCEADAVLYWIHGGGFATFDSLTAINVMPSVQKRCSALGVVVKIFSLDYTLTPAAVFPTQIDQGLVFIWCVRSEHYSRTSIYILTTMAPTTPIILLGDSAGGNLCLALLQRLRTASLPLPKSAVLLSPCVDASLSAASWARLEGLDIVPHAAAMRMSTAYLPPSAEIEGLEEGDEQVTVHHPLVSPINADLTGFPPLLILYGDSEAMIDDIERFAEKAKRFVEADVIVGPGMPHDYPLIGPWLGDEVERAWCQIASFICRTAPS